MCVRAHVRVCVHACACACACVRTRMYVCDLPALVCKGILAGLLLTGATRQAQPVRPHRLGRHPPCAVPSGSCVPRGGPVPGGGCVPCGGLSLGAGDSEQMSPASVMAEGGQAWPGWVRGGPRGEDGRGAGRTWETRQVKITRPNSLIPSLCLWNEERGLGAVSVMPNMAPDKCQPL